MAAFDYRLDQFPGLAWKEHERTREVVSQIRNITEAGVSDHHLGLLYRKS